MSMLLFTLCLIPLLRILEQKLPGIRIGWWTHKTTVVAYADVTLFVTAPADIQIVREAIQCCERASGACLNTRKSKALAVAVWDNTTEVLDIPYYNEVQILGFSTASTVEKSANTSWTKLMARTREQARGVYRRELCLSHRICYVHSHLLAKIWHTAQVFPAPRVCVRQLTLAVAWYIWLGATYISVSISTLQRKKNQGGWELLNVAAKCGTLLNNGMHSWHKYWCLIDEFSQDSVINTVNMLPPGWWRW